jgi:hypothetical protein
LERSRQQLAQIDRSETALQIVRLNTAARVDLRRGAVATFGVFIVGMGCIVLPPWFSQARPIPAPFVWFGVAIIVAVMLGGPLNRLYTRDRFLFDRAADRFEFNGCPLGTLSTIADVRTQTGVSFEGEVHYRLVLRLRGGRQITVAETPRIAAQPGPAPPLSRLQRSAAAVAGQWIDCAIHDDVGDAFALEVRDLQAAVSEFLANSHPSTEDEPALNNNSG